MDKIKSVFTKEDANKALDNVNMWINNCDTKTSIILGFYAIIVTICFSTDLLNIQIRIFSYFLKDICFFKIIYIIIHLATFLIFIIGIIELLKVIIPRIILKTQSGNYNSILFYGSIAKNTPTYEKYCEEVRKITDQKDILNDLLFQIHSASIICNKKFYYQKIGLILTTISMILFLVTSLFGIYIMNM